MNANSAKGSEESGEIIRAKGIMDGAMTLPAAARKVRALSEDLWRLHDEGYVLDGPVEDDYGHLRRKAGQ